MGLDKESKVTIKIPRPLYRRLQAILEGSGFASVTDFVTYVLRDIASSGGVRKEAARPVEHAPEPDRFTPEEVELVRQRLRKLGYL